MKPTRLIPFTILFVCLYLFGIMRSSGVFDTSFVVYGQSAVPRPAPAPAPTAASPALANTVTAPRKVLFIGNSLTYYEGGIYSHLEKFATVGTDKSVFGGAYFKSLWERSEPRQMINQAGNDVVVLQEDLPETKVADFLEYGRRFVDEVRKTGARPILLMAWDYPRLGWISMDEIAKAHADLAKELGVEVAPVGLAWKRAMKERPQLNLYAADREHPNVFGTYLATAVVYATIYRQSPEGVNYAPPGVTRDQAAFLQRTAWETVREYR